MRDGESLLLDKSNSNSGSKDNNDSNNNNDDDDDNNVTQLSVKANQLRTMANAS